MPAPDEARMSEFGRYLRTLMMKRGIEFRGDLADALTEGGIAISRTTLSFYMNGTRRPTWLFVRAVEVVMDLSADERNRLEELHLSEWLSLAEDQEELLSKLRPMAKSTVLT